MKLFHILRTKQIFEESISDLAKDLSGLSLARCWHRNFGLRCYGNLGSPSVHTNRRSRQKTSAVVLMLVLFPSSLRSDSLLYTLSIGFLTLNLIFAYTCGNLGVSVHMMQRNYPLNLKKTGVGAWVGIVSSFSVLLQLTCVLCTGRKLIWTIIFC